MLPVTTGVFQTSIMLSLLKYLQKAAIIESRKTEQSTVNILKLRFCPGLPRNKII